MRDFMLIFEGGDPDWAETMPPEQMGAVMQEWGAWFAELEKSGNVRNPGAALEYTGVTLAVRGDDLVTDALSVELKELIGGYSVIQAETIEQATEIAKGCPHLRGGPDARIQIRPVFMPSVDPES